MGSISYSGQLSSFCKCMSLSNQFSFDSGLLQHWRRLGSTPHANNIFHMAASAEVETTSYGLLATLGYYGDKAVTKGQPIVLWLSQQRNAFGGFSSTQVKTKSSK